MTYLMKIKYFQIQRFKIIELNKYLFWGENKIHVNQSI